LKNRKLFFLKKKSENFFPEKYSELFLFKVEIFFPEIIWNIFSGKKLKIFPKKARELFTESNIGTFSRQKIKKIGFGVRVVSVCEFV
jgi:hypothetical protein